jgi:hypothetical protein
VQGQATPARTRPHNARAEPTLFRPRTWSALRTCAMTRVRTSSRRFSSFNFFSGKASAECDGHRHQQGCFHSEALVLADSDPQTQEAHRRMRSGPAYSSAGRRGPCRACRTASWPSQSARADTEISVQFIRGPGAGPMKRARDRATALRCRWSRSSLPKPLPSRRYALPLASWQPPWQR